MVGLPHEGAPLKRVDRRPNAVQTLLAGALSCSPTLSLRPHLIRYLSKTINPWNPKVRDTTMDALAET